MNAELFKYALINNLQTMSARVRKRKRRQKRASIALMAIGALLITYAILKAI